VIDMRSKLQPVCVACAVALSLLAFALPAVAAESVGDSARLKAPEIFERTLDLMVTLDLALFAAVGFFAKDGLINTTGRRRTFQVFAAVLFVLCAVLSLFFAYKARLEMMRQLAGGTFAYEDLNDYVFQAWALLIASVFAGAFVAIAVSDRPASTP
jgi:MFS family permease